MALGQYFDAQGVRDTINAKAETFACNSALNPKPEGWNVVRLFLGFLRFLTKEDKPQFMDLVAATRMAT